MYLKVVKMIGNGINEVYCYRKLHSKHLIDSDFSHNYFWVLNEFDFTNILCSGMSVLELEA